MPARNIALTDRLILPFSQRITDELAADIGVEVALVVGPAGGKAWPVEVGEDGDGAFLGRGWPEFAAAYGAGAVWLLVLRHRGRGVLFAKTFDVTGCLRELGAPASPAGTTSSKDSTHKPQFIRVLPKDFMQKMLIPAKFVQQHIPKELLDKGTAIVLGPIGKVFSIKLEIGQSGMFFADDWSQFLKFHCITEANALLLRYEGNTVFTVKVYELNGYQRLYKHKENRGQQTIQKQQEISNSSSKCKRKSNWPSTDREKRPKGSMTSSKMKSSVTNCAYELGPPAWLTKKINTSMMRKHHLTFPAAFCNAIGFQDACMITFKTLLSSTRSWQVRLLRYKHTSHQVGSGWRRFCCENKITEGDVCTFNVIDLTLWHVTIVRR
ncbi:hypothetical protein HU200_001311 [Digitaria exilis]|uniref:TF-B3 domain-containing protein n=1 Tax=Digitaria exilis TaxID=1010633 RepID=A0A835G073_9POAL|nr:hypothetical protein HU200_001311 [Digitaria exilis]